MASALFTWHYDNGVTAGQVELDASINETHITTAQITDHQVEKGPNIADHIRPMPKKLTINGIITNHPIVVASTQMRGTVGLPNGRVTTKVRAKQGAFPVGLPIPPMGSVVEKVFDYSALTFSADFDRVWDCYYELTNAQQNGALFTVDTSLRSYSNMAIENITIPRSADTGNSLMLSIDMKEILLAEVITLKALPKAIEVAHKGRQPTKDITEAEEHTQVRSMILGMAQSGGLVP